MVCDGGGPNPKLGCCLCPASRGFLVAEVVVTEVRGHYMEFNHLTVAVKEQLVPLLDTKPVS